MKTTQVTFRGVPSYRRSFYIKRDGTGLTISLYFITVTINVFK